MARDGLEHLTFACELYKDQIDSKRFFLHEHPAQARSWDLWMFREILEMPCVVKILGDQFAFGLWCTDTNGPALFRKPTGWMTNSPKIAKAPDRRCCGGQTLQLFSAGAHKMRVAERYPLRLVNAVLRALRREVRERNQLSATETGQHVDEPDVCLPNPEYYERGP